MSGAALSVSRAQERYDLASPIRQVDIRRLEYLIPAIHPTQVALPSRAAHLIRTVQVTRKVRRLRRHTPAGRRILTDPLTRHPRRHTLVQRQRWGHPNQDVTE